MTLKLKVILTVFILLKQHVCQYLPNAVYSLISQVPKVNAVVSVVLQ